MEILWDENTQLEKKTMKIRKKYLNQDIRKIKKKKKKKTIQKCNNIFRMKIIDIYFIAHDEIVG